MPVHAVERSDEIPFEKELKRDVPAVVEEKKTQAAFFYQVEDVRYFPLFEQERFGRDGYGSDPVAEFLYAGPFLLGEIFHAVGHGCAVRGEALRQTVEDIHGGGAAETGDRL